MGKINEYQRKQLVSSAVGAVPSGTAGQIIGETISKVGGAISAREQKLDMYAGTQANMAVMQFGLAFQKFGAQAQREMADNPDKYAERIFTGGQQMATEFAKGIKDEAVRAKFLTGANTILKAGVIQAGTWEVFKKKDNATIAAKDAIRLGIIQAGNTLTKEQLLQNISTVREMAANEIPDEILSAKDKQTFIDKDMGGSLESHFSNRVRNNPEQLIKELKAGDYEDVPYYTNAMKVKYLGQAETKIRRNENRIKEAQTTNYTQCTEYLLDGTLDFNTVDTFRTAEKKEDSINLRQAINLKKGLVLQIEADARNLQKNDKDARQYIELITQVFDTRIERVKVMDQIIEVFKNGVSPTELKFLANFKANAKETITYRRAIGWKKIFGNISNKVNRLWRGKDATFKKAKYAQDMVVSAMAGIPPEASLKPILKKIEEEKIIENNSFLAGFEDPIEENYRLQAIERIEDNNEASTKNNVLYVMEQLKTDNARKNELEEKHFDLDIEGLTKRGKVEE